MTSSVAIIHYHLRRGGVTRVIETACGCLRDAGVPHLVLSGEPYQGNEDLPVRVIDGLGYLENPGERNPATLLASLRSAVAEALGTESPHWHIHNHSLGKNCLFADVVAALAGAGESLLLQIHDFAEDGRPANYSNIPDPRSLYPSAARIHYAFLNSRDRDLMIAAGIPPASAHLLPNAVAPPAAGNSKAQTPNTRLVLYPVRGIRRKNLGEIFMLAALAPEDARFAVTLGAENPHWQPFHDAWKNFASDSGLPVILEAVGHHPPAPGIDPSFGNWLSHATHLVTTSVAEGFGLAFLEPIGLGKPLLGRDLPEITRDFRDQGINPGCLYQRMLIPQSWVDATALRAELTATLEATLGSYGRPAEPDVIDATWHELHHHDHFDFANLPERFQRQAILCARQPGSADDVLVDTGDDRRSATVWLAEALASDQATATPVQLASYAPDSYAAKLTTLYSAATSAAPSAPTFLPPSSVLDRFLSPARFNFLRT